MGVSGYNHPSYVASLTEFGEPLELPRCQGWLLRRSIAGTPDSDAMGCYPLFSCEDWSRLADDLASVGGNLVSVAIVADPFGTWELTTLRRAFDRVEPFKNHFAVDLRDEPERFITKHHRYYARKALRKLRVECSNNPAGHLEEWTSLYSNLVRRHRLNGIKAFSGKSFEKQLSVPGLVMFRILHGDVCVGAHLWFVKNGVAHSHLLALDDTGYELDASYGLYSEAIRMFRERPADPIRWVNLGAGAGIGASATDGLTQFKRGWSNGSRQVFFCARVLNNNRYASICEQSASARGTTYFPAYRHNELV
jgi:hypothetical protein